jgi:hypothetical protein
MSHIRRYRTGRTRTPISCETTALFSGKLWVKGQHIVIKADVTRIAEHGRGATGYHCAPLRGGLEGLCPFKPPRKGHSNTPVAPLPCSAMRVTSAFMTTCCPLTHNFPENSFDVLTGYGGAGGNVRQKGSRCSLTGCCRGTSGALLRPRRGPVWSALL